MTSAVVGVSTRLRNIRGILVARLLMILCAFIGISGAALAADLPPSPPRVPAVYVPAVLPVYNWAGIYVVSMAAGAGAVSNIRRTPSAASPEQPALSAITAVWSAARSAPISRPAPLCSASRATGIIRKSIPARLPASVPSVAIAKPAIIGWRRRGGAQVMRPIASYSISRLAAPSPMCRRISTALPRPIPSPGGPQARSRMGLRR